ncbi:MAG TPA: hypothetical protein DCM08_06910 [Microscillaceae bacterium]|jgi:hypothetical protein|nr:hypothetical protein [Microscillaceae bacterium]
MTIVLRLLRYLTMLIFIGFFLFSYYDMAERAGDQTISLYYLEENKPALKLDRTTYFYSAMAVFLGINLLFSLLRKFFKTTPPQLLPIFNRTFWNADPENRNKVQYILEGWLAFMGLAFNTLLIVLLAKVWTFNRELKGSHEEFQPYFFIGLVVIGLCGLFLPLRFLIKK